MRGFSLSPGLSRVPMGSGADVGSLSAEGDPVRGQGRSPLELDHLDFEGRLVADDPAAREADAGHATEVSSCTSRSHGADLDYYRKHAKALVRAHRSGDADAHARVAHALGERDRFLLADALHVIAREHGQRSWPELKRAVEASRSGTGLADLRDGAEALVSFGLTYADGEPVQVRVRRRGHRVDIDDRERGSSAEGARRLAPGRAGCRRAPQPQHQPPLGRLRAGGDRA